MIRPALVGLLACGCVTIDPLVLEGRARRRNLDCVRLSQEEAFARYPGQVSAPPAREIADANVDVLTCSQRYLRPGDRPARDEAILSTLTTQVTGLAESASALVPGDVVWHVDAFYPSARVGQKISVAAKTVLAERGLAVSDRVPTLAAGDVAVLATLPPSDVYRLACSRAWALSVLRADEVLLGLMVVDPKETQLHAGVCHRGEWRWVP